MTPRTTCRWTLAAALVWATTILSSAIAREARTIQIATHYSQDQMAPLLACFDRYERENDGIEIEFQQNSYRDFLQTVLTARFGGISPDVYNIYSIWAPQLAAAGTLAKPPAEVAKWIRGSYGDQAVAAATIEDTLLGIPSELSVYQLFYNRQLLNEAGYDEPPVTWDELHEIAAAITETNGQGNITTAGYVFGPTVANAAHVYYSQMFNAGVPPYSEDLRSTNFSHPESVRIIARQGALFAEGITSNSATTDDFAAGRAAMMIAGNWNKRALQEAFGEDFEDIVGVAPIPGDGRDPATMLYSFFWSVDSSSDVQAESWELLEWLNTAQEDQQLSCVGQMLHELGALTGNLADLDAMPTGDSVTAPFVEAVETGAARSQPNIWQASENDRILRRYIEQVWAGAMTAEEAMAAADAEVSAILAEQD